jgi:hypothetical protein
MEVDTGFKMVFLVQEDGKGKREVTLDEAIELLKGVYKQAKKRGRSSLLKLERNYQPDYITAFSEPALEYFYTSRGWKVRRKYLPIKTFDDGVYLRGKYLRCLDYFNVDGEVLPFRYEAPLLQVFYVKRGETESHLLEVFLLIEGTAKMEKQEIKKLRKFIRTAHMEYRERLVKEVFGPFEED